VPGQPVTGNVLDNDSDPDGDTLTVTGFLVDTNGDGTPEAFNAGETATITRPDGTPVGTIVINADGSFVFTPTPGYAGPVPEVVYTVTDGAGGTATAVLRLTDVPQVPPVPAPAPPPTPETEPAPKPAPETPRVPPGERPVTETPRIPSITPPVSSALHVLYAVNSASTERGTFTSGLAAAQLSSPLLGEALSQLPDNLMFDSSGLQALVQLIEEPAFGEVINPTPALHVQYAVRHQPITSDHGLFVQRAVRSSQLESQLRSATLDSQNSASPGYSSLFDPFALGAPKQELSAGQVALADEVTPQAPVVAQPAPEASPVTAIVHEVPAEAKPQPVKAAPGFRAQMERFAKDREHSARPITRSATVKS